MREQFLGLMVLSIYSVLYRNNDLMFALGSLYIVGFVYLLTYILQREL